VGKVRLTRLPRATLQRTWPSFPTDQSYDDLAFTYAVDFQGAHGGEWSDIYANGSLYGIIYDNSIAAAFTSDELLQVIDVGPSYSAAGWTDIGYPGSARIPEPSAYAAIFSRTAFGFVAIRKWTGDIARKSRKRAYLEGLLPKPRAVLSPAVGACLRVITRRETV
jgi:hypothetical protein